MANPLQTQIIGNIMKYIAFSFLFLLSSCATVDLSKIHNDTYITCVSSLDDSKLDYLKSQRIDAPSVEFPSVTVSTITDIHGKVLNINSQEWTQYTCNEKALP
jgi:hypothetical protein